MLLAVSALLSTCKPDPRTRTMTLIDPGHFHASLIQKSMLQGVSETVRVFAPEGAELRTYLQTIDSYNSRPEQPTSWKEEVHVSGDGPEELPEARRGDFVVLAGNNRKKADHILTAVRKGYHILADKPMAINEADFEKLKDAYTLAHGKGLLICDLMTERYDLLNIVARKLISDRELFGDPVEVAASSVHHFYKNVSGKVLLRPAWYYDVRQQGEGIADVTTHLVDQVFWLCFPGEPIREQDVKLLDAEHGTTAITLGQYTASTGAAAFPGYLDDAVMDGILQVLSNGSITFSIKDIPARIAVRWDFEATEGAGDTSESLFRGTRATIRFVQDASTDFIRQLLLTAPEEPARKAIEALAKEYSFLRLTPAGERTFRVEIPVENRLGHEDHFHLVAQAFLDGLDGRGLPEWEATNTLTKYYLTTGATRMAAAKNHQQ